MSRYWTTADVARETQMSEEWVREHAAELGGMRVGDSTRGPLRFLPHKVDAGMEARALQPPKRGRRRRPGPARQSSGGVPLIPLPETVV